MQLEHALERYLRQLAANGRSVHTIGQVRRHLRLLARWLGQEHRPQTLSGIDEDILAEFLTSEVACTTARGGAKTPGTMNALRSSLKSFFGAASLAGWVPRDPARFIKQAICGPAPPRSLTVTEEDRLRTTLAQAEGDEARRDHILVELMLATGVRLSSALGLRVEDVDLDEGVLLLRQVKGSRVERVLMGPEIRALLAEFLVHRESGPVFARGDGNPISARHAQRRFRAWREAAGISRAVTPHSMRHTFGQRLYDQTRDLLLVQRALRHRSISSTLTYAHAK